MKGQNQRKRFSPLLLFFPHVYLVIEAVNEQENNTDSPKAAVGPDAVLAYAPPDIWPLQVLCISVLSHHLMSWFGHVRLTAGLQNDRAP